MTRRGAGRAGNFIGAHMSIAGGLHRALERGHAVGCDVVQIFLKNQMQWKGKPLGEADVRLWKQAQRATGVRTAFAHATYLINLGTPVDAEWRHAIAAFHDELERAETIGLPFVVIHPGSHKGSGIDAGIARVAAALDALVGRTPGYRVRIVLENTAGAGDTIGRTFGELAALLDRSAHPERLGVCLDSCHWWASAVDVTDGEAVDAAIREVDEQMGLERLRCLHVNDAAVALGANRDRHEVVARGLIGDGLATFLGHPTFRDLPAVLETWPEEGLTTKDIDELRRLHRLGKRRAAARSKRSLQSD